MLQSIRRKIQKVRFHFDLSRFNKKEAPDLPLHIQLEPTTRCNLRCLACSRDKVIEDNRPADLAPEAVERIISLFPRLRSVKLQGLGEPFLHPHIEGILKMLKQKKIKVRLISNGTLFGLEKCRRLAYTYVWDTAVSIDSVDSETFAQLRGADIHAIIDGTRQLVLERDRNNPRALIGINSVISYKNYLGLEKLCRLAIDLGVDYVALVAVENWMAPGEKGFEESELFVAESRKYVPQIKKEVERAYLQLLKKGILLAYKDSSRRLGNCPWPFSSLFVTAEGFVTPCCIRMHRQHSFGDISTVRSPEEIWHGNEFLSLRRQHLFRHAATPMCARCPD